MSYVKSGRGAAPCVIVQSCGQTHRVSFGCMDHIRTDTLNVRSVTLHVEACILVKNLFGVNPSSAAGCRERLLGMLGCSYGCLKRKGHTSYHVLLRIRFASYHDFHRHISGLSLAVGWVDPLARLLQLEQRGVGIVSQDFAVSGLARDRLMGHVDVRSRLCSEGSRPEHLDEVASKELIVWGLSGQEAS